MTPFGEKVRELRAVRGTTLAEMADVRGVSTAYLSALEHGKRGTPRAVFLELVNAYFALDWDEAEELRQLAGILAQSLDRYRRPQSKSDRACQQASGAHWRPG